ncbi:MAG: hypothetical protein U9O49_04245 [Candidatus Thermoplasmatota archaeon]|nr:hypothetical protein [Candidatus Thermoplasmatota archaeon]
MDIIALSFGFVVGVAVVGIAIELGMKKTTRVAPASKHTDKWDISEIVNPRIMAEYLVDADIPKNSKVIVNQCKDRSVLSGIDAKEHEGIKGNFILGDDRALILAGPLKKDEVAFWTVEKEIVEKLNQEFDEMWNEATSLNQKEK